MNRYLKSELPLALGLAVSEYTDSALGPAAYY
jgi:hypothetical protein